MVERANWVIALRSEGVSLLLDISNGQLAGVTKVLSSPYTVPLDYLRWPIQFESKGTSQTNDVIVAVDHWSIWEPA
jgi:hypothetical protein